MSSQPAIIGEHITKQYQLYKNQNERLRGFLFGKGGKPFLALRDISFAVERGDSIGLLGMNGSGKSTLSNIIAGLSQPTSGVITTRGTSSLIAISSGLNPYLTGNENIKLKGLMLGFDQKQIDEMRGLIIEFADIGQFIEQPVKSYSSGMKARLGFAISVCVDPDILIIDEALSVGDPTFAHKCLNKMESFREEGKTIVFVSHSIPQVRSFCNKAMWLEYGRMRAIGDSDEIADAYEAFLNDYNRWTAEEQKKYKETMQANL